MKALHLFTFAAVSLAIVSTTIADEKRSDRRASKAVPYRNYWDANLWDPIAGSGFWHESQDRRAPFRSRKTQKPLSPLLMPVKKGTIRR